MLERVVFDAMDRSVMRPEVAQRPAKVCRAVSVVLTCHNKRSAGVPASAYMSAAKREVFLKHFPRRKNVETELRWRRHARERRARNRPIMQLDISASDQVLARYGNQLAALGEGQARTALSAR